MLNKLKNLTLLGGLFTTINACDGWIFEVPQSSQMTEKSEANLVVLTVNHPLSYQKINGQIQGYEYDLLTEFAKERGYNLKFKILKNSWETVKYLQEKKGDIAAARLPSHFSIRGSMNLSPAFDDQYLSLICDKGVSDPLSNHIKVGVLRKNMSLGAQTKFKKKYPNIHMKSFLKLTTLDLFQMLHHNKFNCLISDRWEANLYMRFFPSLEEKEKLEDGHPYHFLVVPNSKLQSELTYWFQKAARLGQLERIRYRYMGYLKELTRQDLAHFFSSLDIELKVYKNEFKKSANKFNLPWQLVAAVSFQESHWQANAESYTGVEGLMQLTKCTAKHLGVEDRRDPSQSILGGAKYLHDLIDYQPQNLAYRERLALALIAYNSGLANLYEAQTMARELGKNELSWKDLKSVLKFTYGSIRGTETIQFVNRVLNYYDLLVFTQL